MMEEMETEIQDETPDTDASDEQDGELPSEDEASGTETDESDSGQSGDEDQEASEDDPEKTGDDTETSGTDDAEPGTAEDETEEDGTEEDETDVPSESLNINGNILVLPEGYEFNPDIFSPAGEEKAETDAALSSEQLDQLFEQFEQLSEQLEQTTEAVTVQTDVLYGGTAVISLILGAVLGVLLIHGFRLRRI